MQFCEAFSNDGESITASVSPTLIAIQKKVSVLSIGVDLLKERTDTDDYDVHSDWLILLLDIMPEVAQKDLGESDIDYYHCFQELNHILHKSSLEEADSKNFRMLFKTTFDKITAMHSRLYLHIAYHFVDLIEKSLVDLLAKSRNVGIEYVNLVFTITQTREYLK
jgi:hypothetical protein